MVGVVVKREASASVAGVQQLIGTFTENQEKQSWSPKTKLEPQSPGEGKRKKRKEIDIEVDQVCKYNIVDCQLYL